MTQRALILGAQNDPRGLTDAFRALLKEYPNTEAARWRIIPSPPPLSTTSRTTRRR